MGILGIPWSHAARIREVLLYKQHNSEMVVECYGHSSPKYAAAIYCGLFSIAFMLHFLHMLDVGDVQ